MAEDILRLQDLKQKFNMFNYLKLKGLDNSELAKHFEKIDETNENINSILEKNPGAILKEIKVTYLDKEKKNIQFDINIEVVNS